MKNKKNSIDIQLNKICERKKIGLMTHMVFGYPDIESSMTVIKGLADGGADFIEIQIPFSDPIADGPTIMKACEVALERGATVEKALHFIKKAKQKIDISLILMCYYNTVFQYGVKKFCEAVAKAGVSGIIVPDIPVDEEKYENFLSHCRASGLYTIMVISPASTEKRLDLIAKNATGFVYCISRFGVTGAKRNLDTMLPEYLKRVKKHFKIPLAVGFGISKPEHVARLREYADIAIIGSAIIEIIERSKKNDLERNINMFVKAFQNRV